MGQARVRSPELHPGPPREWLGTNQPVGPPPAAYHGAEQQEATNGSWTQMQTQTPSWSPMTQVPMGHRQARHWRTSPACNHLQSCLSPLHAGPCHPLPSGHLSGAALHSGWSLQLTPGQPFLLRPGPSLLHGDATACARECHGQGLPGQRRGCTPAGPPFPGVLAGQEAQHPLPMCWVPSAHDIPMSGRAYLAFSNSPVGTQCSLAALPAGCKGWCSHSHHGT